MSKITFTTEAQENIAETGADWESDLRALKSGEHTEESLLELCLNGADEDRVQGWREYVETLVAAAAE